MKTLVTSQYLDMAYKYADGMSGCRKVAVGSVIAKDGMLLSFGANKAIPDLCHGVQGCLRVSKYGNDSKQHRDPADCRAIHSEIDAICMAARMGNNIDGATIYVTRYPCESCAKAIVAAGIKTVYYGGTAQISPVTQEIFGTYGVNCYFVENWHEDNTDR